MNMNYAGQQPMMVGQANPWTITAEQLNNYQRMFTGLNPTNGYLSGESARNYFMRSNLPSNVLAQIWGLSDMDNDGRLSIQEFCIAVHLIQNKLRGVEVPRVLPYSIKSTVASVPKIPPKDNLQMATNSNTLPARGFANNATQSTISSFGNWSKSSSSTGGLNLDSAINSQLSGMGGMTQTNKSSTMPMQIATSSGNDPQQQQAAFGETKAANFSSSFDQLAGFPSSSATVGSNFGGQDSESMPRKGSVLAGQSDKAFQEPIPQNLKVKYTQVFNRYDRAKTGFIQGSQARDILSQSRLAQQILIQIWNLSDIDNDGRLTGEEFCLALYLCDLAKDGVSMPESLPPALVPASYVRRRSSMLQSEVVDSKQTAFPISSVSLEERKKRNFEQGRQELERRRQELQDKLRREQEERRQREVAEEEKRQRERMEQERKKQEAMERLRQQQEAIEREKEAQRKAMIEKRLAEQLEKERQRQKDWEDRRREELSAQKKKEEAVVTTLRSRLSELQMDLSSLQRRKTMAEENLSKYRYEKEQHVTSLNMISSSISIRKSELEALRDQYRDFTQKYNASNQEREQTAREFSLKGRTTTAVACDAVTASCKEMKSTLQRLQMNLQKLNNDTQLKQTEFGGLISHRDELSQDVKKRNLELQKLQQMKDVKQRQFEFKSGKKSTASSDLLSLDTMSNTSRNQSSVSNDKARSQNDDLFSVNWTDVSSPSNSTTARKTKEDKKNDAFGLLLNTDDNTSKDKAATSNLFESNFGSDDKKSSPFSGFQNNFETKNTTSSNLGNAFDTNWPQQSSNIENKTSNAGTDDIMDNIGAEWSTVGSNKDQNQEDTNKKVVGVDAFGSMSWDTTNQSNFAAFEASTDTSVSMANTDTSDDKEIAWKSAFEPAENAKRKTLTSAIGATSAFMAGITMELANPQSNTNESKNTVPYKAMYSFDASNDDEISLEVGDKLMIFENENVGDGWLYGEKNGKVGILPRDFVEKIVEPHKSTEDINTDSLSLQSGNPSLRSDGSQRTTKGLIARAIADYDKTADDELSFKENDYITIVERSGDGWWTGEFNGRRGLIPSTYLEMEDLPQMDDTSTNSIISAANFERKNSASPAASPTTIGVSESETYAFEREEYGVALYNYRSNEAEDLQFDEGDRILIISCEGDWWKGNYKGKSGIFPANYVELVVQNKDNSFEYVKAISDYTKQDDSQISFYENDVILVLNKETNGWWEGELQNSPSDSVRGWFPASYVQLTELNEPPESDTDNTPAFANQVLAIYDFSASKPDELAFHQGNIINVIENDDNDWWQGELNGVIGYFPATFVQSLSSNHTETETGTESESLDARMLTIKEFIETEEKYLKDLILINEIYIVPMRADNNFDQEDLDKLFINWSDVISCSTKLLQAIEQKSQSGNDAEAFATVLRDVLPTMMPYAVFCSHQMAACKYLQEKNSDTEFKEYQKRCSADPRSQGLPLSSFLLKPMQRVTRYPLLLDKIMKYTPEVSSDYRSFQSARKAAIDLCKKVNESVTQKETADKFLWLQHHVNCSDSSEDIVFNSKTNCLGQRKLLHSGPVVKAKSNRELVAFLFNDFLLLTKPLKSSTISRVFFEKSDEKYQMYKPPFMLNEVNVKKVSDDPAEDKTMFSILYREKWISLKVDKESERNLWVKKIVGASHKYKKIERQQGEETKKAAKLKANVGQAQLTVFVIDAQDLKTVKRDGKCDPYVQVNLAKQKQTTKVQPSTTTPTWNSTLHFYAANMAQELLLLTILDKRYYAPDDFLGSATIPLSQLINDGLGPWKKSIKLNGVNTGTLNIKINLLYQSSGADDIYQ